MNKNLYKATEVAKYFIHLASQEVVGDNGEREGITNLKLQKILYFAQALFLSKLEKPLFQEQIEAWEYGPVVPEVYEKYKTKGSNVLVSKSKEEDIAISDEDKARLREVWDIFGDYSASKLVDIAHAHDPWKEAHASEGEVISDEKMQDYYSNMLN